MNANDKEYLKKQARRAFQNGSLGLAKDACKIDIDAKMPAQIRRQFTIVETDNMCFYIKRNPQLDGALASIEAALKATGMSLEQLLQEFQSMRSRCSEYLSIPTNHRNIERFQFPS